MKACCLETIEDRLRTVDTDEDGTMVKCAKFPKQSNHRIYLRDGKWVGTWLTARH